ncbi:succinylglutamate desuccinylase/aspartoacylase family protein [Alphaproteobacteria bacterium]|nr:succinylglutamate desuccinylase/aspartoacylase family protein [Alphaproteobacteria bacterium]
MKKTRLEVNIDLHQPGKRAGDILLRWSDNVRPLGVYPVPIACIIGEAGPTALLIAGVHGDEFEGPVALSQLIAEIEADQIVGRLIILPAFNCPAVLASERISPLDGRNMNRAFPGDPDGGPTDMLADFLVSVLLPEADLVIDLHAGGKASVFATSALASRSADKNLMQANLDLAKAFGAPLIWLLGAFNDTRSLNAAALNAGVPMIAAELGGGGGTDPVQVSKAVLGVKRCLAHAGIINEVLPKAPPSMLVETRSSADNIYAPVTGLVDRQFAAGDVVKAGQLAGYVRSLDRLDEAPIALHFGVDGVVLAHGNRGYVVRGDMLAMLVCKTEI